jgi:predicted transcriptional regulator
MTTITIQLPDKDLRKLEELAARFQVTPEELARLSIEELLSRPDETFRQAVEHTLQKNSDLYRRLA